MKFITEVLNLKDIEKDGYEDVFPFCESLGFAVRRTVLQLQ